jgi:hypothetical protein
LTTTGAKTVVVLQANDHQIIEMDDIQCDLDEEIDDEHYTAVAGTGNAAQGGSEGETKG